MPDKPRLFALLVGINKYQFIRPLTGCENDISRISQFLETHVAGTMDYHPLLLQKANATKTGIVEAFESHLIRKDQVDSDALQPGDVVLFYFSGHGAQEEAHPAFLRWEPNGYIETLACYDSDLDTGKNFLADKELRYLIHQVAQPGVELLTIFDCCHAGDNTRAPASKDLVERLAGQVQARDWKDFIFHKKVSPEYVTTAGLDQALPQGTHIQLAACDSYESAWEQTDVGGVFTTALLDALQKSAGDLSYLELKNRTRNAVRSSKVQNPQLYAAFGEKPSEKQLATDASNSRKMLFKTFLGGAIREKPIAAEVYFNTLEQRWELDKGAVYGVTTEWNGLPQSVLVTTTSNKAIEATVQAVFPGFSILEFKSNTEVSLKERYEALVPSLLFRLLPFTLSGDDQGLERFHQFAPTEVLLSQGLKIVSPKENPAYAILAEEDNFLLTLPGEEMSLIAPVEGYHQEAIEKLLSNLKAIRRWNFVKHLQNPALDNKLASNALGIELTWNGQILSADAEGAYQLGFDPSPTPSGEMKLQITNKSNIPLYIGAVYLSSTFGIASDQFWPQPYTVKLLDTQKNAFEGYTLQIEDFVLANNWPAELIYFKLIAGVTPFDLDLLDQEDLEEPVTRSGGAKRGLLRRTPNPQDWQTRLLPLHLINPNYKSLVIN